MLSAEEGLGRAVSFNYSLPCNLVPSLAGQAKARNEMNAIKRFLKVSRDIFMVVSFCTGIVFFYGGGAASCSYFRFPFFMELTGLNQARKDI